MGSTNHRHCRHATDHPRQSHSGRIRGTRRQRQNAREQTQAHQAAVAEKYQLYQNRLHQAAGIATMTLVCHSDTRQFVDQHCSQRNSSRTPNRTEITDLPDGLRQVALSGPQLLPILFVMADLARIERGIGIVPLATQLSGGGFMTTSGPWSSSPPHRPRTAKHCHRATAQRPPGGR
jgi:hypothetical protein